MSRPHTTYLRRRQMRLMCDERRRELQLQDRLALQAHADRLQGLPLPPIRDPLEACADADADAQRDALTKVH